MNYYNEIDPYCAKWLQNLMDAGHIPAGVIDTRSIEDVTPQELTGFTQCHFFAGIGGWSLALRLARWPDDKPVWTGSCPCQPFSSAGKGAGFEDERHLWPAWQHLIEQCKPPVIFGEQVASKAVDPWTDLVHADLEGMGYAFGGVAFPAAGIGAPHIRDRTYWVADTNDARLEGRRGVLERADQFAAGSNRMAGWLADASGAGSLSSAHAGVHRVEGGARSRHGELERPGAVGGMADAQGNRHERAGEQREPTGRYGLAHLRADGGDDRHDRPGPTNGQWADADWLGCTDGKWRPVEPGTFPLAHGVPGRVGRLRAYGNAIVPAQAAEFITAFAEVKDWADFAFD